MSLIPPDLWSAYLPGKMPEYCTHEQFAAACELVWKEEDTEWVVQFMANCDDRLKEWAIGWLYELQG